MMDVKNSKLSLQVRDEKVEFSLPQAMASPTSGDSCCRVDVLEKALNEEGKARFSVEDPLEAALTGCHVINSVRMRRRSTPDSSMSLLPTCPGSPIETSLMWRSLPLRRKRNAHRRWN